MTFSQTSNCDPCAKTQLLLRGIDLPKSKSPSRDFIDTKTALRPCMFFAKKCDVDGHDLVNLIVWLLHHYSMNPLSIGHKLNSLMETIEHDKLNSGFGWFYDQWTGVKHWKELNPLEILRKIGRVVKDVSSTEVDDLINLLGGGSITFNKATDYLLISKVLDFYKEGGFPIQRRK